MRKETLNGDERWEMKMDRARGWVKDRGPKIWGTHTVNSRLESYPIV